MQLLSIIKALTKQELAELKVVVQAQNRAPLLALFNKLAALSASERPYETVDVFEAVFAQPFDKSKIYLLHNEVRNLKQLANKFLADNEMALRQQEEEFYTVNYLRALSKKRLDDIFYAQLDKVLQKAEQTYNSKFICELYALKHQHHIAKSFESPLPEDEHIGMILKWQQHEIKRLKYTIREQESEMAYLKRAQAIKKDYLEAFDKDLSFEPIETISLADTNEPWSRYLELTRDQFLYRGQRRVETSKQNLAILSQLGDKLPNRFEEQIDVMFNLASALLSTNQYEEALSYLKQCVIVAAEKHAPQPESVHEMQIRCYIMMRQYQTAIDYFIEHLKAIKKTAYYVSTVGLIWISYLFLKDGKKAIESSLLIGTPNPRVDISKRYLFIIAFIIDNDFEQAKRELINLKRMKQFKQMGGRLKFVVKLYDKLCDAYLSNKEGKKKKLAELESIIKDSNKNLQIIDMHFLWIKRYVLG